MASNRLDQLIETATELFDRHGFHATGIDRILAESGVAKMTLYKHFKSKDELILAALRRRGGKFRNDFMRAVERRAKTPRARLLALFDVIGDWFAGKGFSGCMFVNAAAEFGPLDNPAHAFAGEHKRLMRTYIQDLAKAAGAADPKALAQGLALLIEGAIVFAYVAGESDAARLARKSARVLLRDAGL